MGLDPCDSTGGEGSYISTDYLLGVWAGGRDLSRS